MEDALCFAMPSLTEGFGLPPLEAMMLGCPALLAPCGALPEVCGDAALYANPHDPDAWKDAILRIRDEPGLRERLVEAGRIQSDQFTWDAAGRRIVETIKRFAAPRKA
jgi:glycosyltransferase involved in cell wall biosynthesis